MTTPSRCFVLATALALAVWSPQSLASTAGPVLEEGPKVALGVPAMRLAMTQEEYDAWRKREAERQRAGVGEQPSSEPEPGAAQRDKAKTQAPSTILEGEVPRVAGPKRTVSVGKFDTIGAFSAQYGNWDIGGGLSAMLTAALKESNRFIVMERANLGQLLSEQELKGSGVVAGTAGPQLGKVIGVQLMIFGAVTEFGAQDSGGGFSIGLSGGSFGLPFSGAISPQSTSGKVALDIRVVDTSTTEVLHNFTVAERISGKAIDLSVGYSGISFGGNSFNKTPLGEATRRAINQAVRQIALTANGIAWSGRVVEFDGGEVYINAGAESGLRVGDMFMIEQTVKTFTDPATGKVLGMRRRELGIVRLSGVEPKLSYGTFNPLGETAPKRGDTVVMMK